MQDNILIIFCTFSNLSEAHSICEHLVEKDLVACCNVLSEVESIYKWENKLKKNREILAVIKTRKDQYEHVEKEIKMLHTYTVPEIIAVFVTKGSAAYLDWVINSSSGR